MKHITFYYFLLPAVLVLMAGCGNSSTNNQQDSSRISLIFETDMGNDTDDALALDMLYKYADMALINFLGVSTNKDNPYSIEFLDLMNTWYGYPKLPMGKITKGVDCENDAVNFAKVTCLYEEKGVSPFARTYKDYAKIPESPLFYRELLAKQPDQSVVIVSVGFSTNLARLLDTPPDQYSPLTGKALVAQKVKMLSMMAGQTQMESTCGDYNVIKDIPSAQKVFNEWPTPIVVSPVEVGIAAIIPASFFVTNPGYATPHPLKIAYDCYMPQPYDRPTWDLTSVLYAVEGADKYFNVSEKGRFEVVDESHARFFPDENGNHVYLSVNSEQVENIINRIINLLSQKPKNL